MLPLSPSQPLSPLSKPAFVAPTPPSPRPTPLYSPSFPSSPNYILFPFARINCQRASPLPCSIPHPVRSPTRNPKPQLTSCTIRPLPLTRLLCPPSYLVCQSALPPPPSDRLTPPLAHQTHPSCTLCRFSATHDQQRDNCVGPWRDLARDARPTAERCPKSVRREDLRGMRQAVLEGVGGNVFHGTQSAVMGPPRRVKGTRKTTWKGGELTDEHSRCVGRQGGRESGCEGKSTCEVCVTFF